MPSPFRIVVLDRGLYRVGDIGAPVSLSAQVRFNGASTCEITVDSDHPLAAALSAEGAAVMVHYAGLTEPLVTGPIRTVAGSFAEHTVTVTAVDTFSLLTGILGWPRPGSALTAQDVAADRREGPAETVARGVILDNARRLGIPIGSTVDLGRGGPAVVAWRMQPISDQLLGALDTAGLAVTLHLAPLEPGVGGRMHSPGLLLDAYMPEGYPRRLSDQAGTVVDWQYTRTAPTATRWVLGAGEDKLDDPTTRLFTPDVDTDAEALWGLWNVSERFLDMQSLGSAVGGAERALQTTNTALQFTQLAVRDRELRLRNAQLAQRTTPTPEGAAALVDAEREYDEAIADFIGADAEFAQAIRDLDAGRLEYAADIAEALAQARMEGAAKTGLSITLAEDSVFRYGDYLKVGNRVRVEVGGQQIVDVLRECSISWTADGGLEVTPVVGEVRSTYRQLVSAVAGLLRRDRNQAVR